jgi:DNA polymerase I-like protein with 3'-5' exonuclease and polymerase domains
MAPQVAQLISREMEGIVALSVPLTAEAKYGKSWYDAK